MPSRLAMKTWGVPASSQEMYATIVPSGETAYPKPPAMLLGS